MLFYETSAALALNYLSGRFNETFYFCNFNLKYLIYSAVFNTSVLFTLWINPLKCATVQTEVTIMTYVRSLWIVFLDFGLKTLLLTEVIDP